MKPRWDAQIRYNFPTLDADPGAVERNQEHHAAALERARLRNLGNGQIPASPPANVVADTVPSKAVDTPRRTVDAEGKTSEEEAIEENNREILAGEEVPAAADSDYNAYQVKRAKQLGAVESSDATLSWGRGGEVETSTGWGDTPKIPAGAGISGGNGLVATPPTILPGQTVTPRRLSYNMADIISGEIK